MPMTDANGLSDNYTQFPHQFYNMIPDQSDAELRVMLVVIRKILGWHKPLDKPEPISLSQFRRETGLAQSSVERGIRAGIQRGWLSKVRNVGPRRTSGYLLNLDVGKAANPVDYHQNEGSPDDSPYHEGSTSPITREEPSSQRGIQKKGNILKESKFKILEIPIPPASSRALRNFIPAGTDFDISPTDQVVWDHRCPFDTECIA